MDMAPKVQGAPNRCLVVGLCGESHGFLGLLLRGQNGMGEEGFPMAVSWRETGTREIGGPWPWLGGCGGPGT